MDSLSEERDKVVLDTPNHCFLCSSGVEFQSGGMLGECSGVSPTSVLTVMQINPLCALLKINPIHVLEAAWKDKVPTMIEPRIEAGLCETCAATYEDLQKEEKREKEAKRKIQEHLETITEKIKIGLPESCRKQIDLHAMSYGNVKHTLGFREGIKNQATLALEQMKTVSGMEVIPGLASYQPMGIESSRGSFGEPSIPLSYPVTQDNSPASYSKENESNRCSSENLAVLPDDDISNYQQTCNQSSEDQSVSPAALIPISIAEESNNMEENPRSSPNNKRAMEMEAKKSKRGPASKTGRPPYITGQNMINEGDAFVESLLQVGHNQNEICINNSVNVAGPSREIDMSLLNTTMKKPNVLINCLQQSSSRHMGIQNSQVKQSGQLLPKTSKTVTAKRFPTLYKKVDGMIECKICDSMFSTLRDCTQHLKSAHNPSCKFCKKQFAHPNAVARHMQICKQNPKIL